jgi:hypothetical protein
MTRPNAPTHASTSVVQAKYARKFASLWLTPTSSSTHAGTVSLAGPKRCSSNMSALSAASRLISQARNP